MGPYAAARGRVLLCPTGDLLVVFYGSVGLRGGGRRLTCGHGEPGRASKIRAHGSNLCSIEWGKREPYVRTWTERAGRKRRIQSWPSSAKKVRFCAALLATHRFWRVRRTRFYAAACFAIRNAVLHCRGWRPRGGPKRYAILRTLAHFQSIRCAREASLT